MIEIEPNRVDNIVANSACKHAGRNVPCWEIHTVQGLILPAICNKRAKKAGFDSRINPQSLRKKSER